MGMALSTAHRESKQRCGHDFDGFSNHLILGHILVVVRIARTIRSHAEKARSDQPIRLLPRQILVR